LSYLKKKQQTSRNPPLKSLQIKPKS
jgi:hypothetical protein